MKHTKRILAIMLVVAMVFAFGTTAFAAGNNTITVNNAQNGETYTAYKMFDLSVDLDKDAYTYTVNSAWSDFFTSPGAGAAFITKDNGIVTAILDNDGNVVTDDAKDLAKAAAKYAKDNSLASAGNAVAADKSATISGLDNGYYLVTSTQGNIAMIDTTPDKTGPVINEKNPGTVIEKEVQEDSTGEWGEKNDAQIGDTVNFHTEFTVKVGARNYVVHDAMTEGLTFNNDIAIEGLTKGTDYTVATGTDDGCTFEITFAQSYLDTVAEDTDLTVTYSAILNEKAVVTEPQINKTQLTWGNNGETGWDQTETYTYKFAVLKYDGADKEQKKPLAGAVFQLKNGGTIVRLIKISDTKYRVAKADENGAVDTFTTVGSGQIEITGVDNDPYTLTEITSPPGFNPLSDDISVGIKTDNSLVFDVENNSGNELPTTGGIGTTLFYVIGAILVCAAGILLVTRKRMNKVK